MEHLKQTNAINDKHGSNINIDWYEIAVLLVVVHSS